MRDWHSQFNTEVLNAVPRRHKVIVREDTQEIISVVGETYKLVTNEDLIGQLLGELDRMGLASYIDDANSFVENRRMRLQVTFPEILIRDSDSQIALSLYLHNSYDGSEAIKIHFGGVRAICLNGMIFGKALANYYARHTSGLDLGLFQQRFQAAINQMPQLQSRISEMEFEPVTNTLRARFEKNLGKRMAKTIFDKQPCHRWQAYNEASYLISHLIEAGSRARYQLGLSSAFRL